MVKNSMDYFLLSQDKRCTNTPQIKELFKNINPKYMNIFDADKIDDGIPLFIKSEENIQYADVLDKQIFIVSEEMKKIMEKYDLDIIFKRLGLIDYEKSEQKIYYLPIFNEVEALSGKSEFNLNKTLVKKIVLDKEKIKNKKIFKIKESDKTLVVVRLDAAESLLRRNFKGISLEKLEIE